MTTQSQFHLTVFSNQFEKRGWFENDDVPKGDLKNNLIKGSIVPAPSVLIKTEWMIKLGGYNPRIAIEDWSTWLRLVEIGAFFWGEMSTVAYYRLLKNSMTGIRTIGFELDELYILKWMLKRRWIEKKRVEKKIKKIYPQLNPINKIKFLIIYYRYFIKI